MTLYDFVWAASGWIGGILFFSDNPTNEILKHPFTWVLIFFGGIISGPITFVFCVIKKACNG